MFKTWLWVQAYDKRSKVMINRIHVYIIRLHRVPKRMTLQVHFPQPMSCVQEWMILQFLEWSC